MLSTVIDWELQSSRPSPKIVISLNKDDYRYYTILLSFFSFSKKGIHSISSYLVIVSLDKYYIAYFTSLKFCTPTVITASRYGHCGCAQIVTHANKMDRLKVNDDNR